MVLQDVLEGNQRLISQMMDLLTAWAFFAVSLQILLKKMKQEKRWRAWVPGLRYLALGESVKTEREGLICGLLDVLSFGAYAVDLYSLNERVKVAMALVTLVVYLFLFIYRIRIFGRVRIAFGLKKRWMILWIFAESLTMLILGLGKKYQPVNAAALTEDWEAGTKPADIPEASAHHGYSATNSGLSVDLESRRVRDGMQERYLLKDISMNIPNGSMVLLLGGSGAGKTTFVNAVIGYEKADAKVLLNGADIYKDYDRMKYRIGFVPQQNLIRGSDTVYHTVADAAQLRLPSETGQSGRDEKVKDVMELLGLTAGAEGLVSKKSGGQLRRISIAMELVSDPELFVLDEPDSGLDGVIAREIFTKLRKIADEGKIVIVITHTPDRVIDLFDKVIVLAKDSGRVGRLAFYGSPAEAKEFFGRDTMEGIVMSVNRKEEGGDGLADEYIERYARLAAAREEGVKA